MNELEQLKIDFFKAFDIQEGYIGWSESDSDYYGYPYYHGTRKFFKTLKELDRANYYTPNRYDNFLDTSYPPISDNTLLELFLLANQQIDIGRDIVSKLDFTEEILKILIKFKEDKTMQETIQFIFYEKEV